ncbi:MAG: M28 family peptidase [Planctomycetes bacterium]|nr:M28 family peptidase [Planctomycetota bacterium]
MPAFRAIVTAGLLAGQFLFAASAAAQPSGEETNFDGRRAYQHLLDICAFGRRLSGSQGMERQQAYLVEHFTALGAVVEKQEFQARDPLTGRAVPMANLIVQWRPDARERILLCAHYDTRPYPDNDPIPARRRGLFVGANDGASGVAVLCELGRHLPQLPMNYGVDFVFFDGEELVYDARRDPYFLGSEHFAREYAANPPPYRYRWGILLDMVGDRDLELYIERNSYSWPDTRPLVESIWSTARRLGVREFIPRQRHWVNDDHVKLHDIAGIPTCDIIDFDYPRPGRPTYWHTTGDTPDKCSAESLGKVGAVLLEWLRNLE